MAACFADRAEAGRQLAEKLTAYRDCNDVVVLALPRGGVSVACEVATRLHLPLDVSLCANSAFPGMRSWRWARSHRAAFALSTKVELPTLSPRPREAPWWFNLYDEWKSTAVAISEPETFTVVFYGSKIFCCKTAQLSETPREPVCLGLVLKNRLRNIAKTCAKTG